MKPHTCGYIGAVFCALCAALAFVYGAWLVSLSVLMIALWVCLLSINEHDRYEQEVRQLKREEAGW